MSLRREGHCTEGGRGPLNICCHRARDNSSLKTHLPRSMTLRGLTVAKVTILDNTSNTNLEYMNPNKRRVVGWSWGANEAIPARRRQTWRRDASPALENPKPQTLKPETKNPKPKTKNQNPLNPRNKNPKTLKTLKTNETKN